ncbi:hypothetical protein WICPIJ_002462 [Wickerhamomyces pijperi]|uniref:Zn(2)-C6 fungal-type domain-containing protein n=1 Tax=Wickerhamomyces pijperi TaxID=599730 RepID=A0A9P8QBS5_WICPI|nr:hypothetical protein WICPIJ_002462 [Wickerhamomyces pijperi]
MNGTPSTTIPVLPDSTNSNDSSKSNTNARRSRLIAPDKRKRAAFSCNRCRIKKIKCLREEDTATTDQHNSSSSSSHVVYNKTTPCTNCAKVDVECITDIPRRRRVYGSFENLGSHYQIVLKLVQGAYPHLDVNDVNELIKLGEGLGIDMSINGEESDSLKNIEVESQVLKPFFPKNFDRLTSPNSAVGSSGCSSAASTSASASTATAAAGTLSSHPHSISSLVHPESSSSGPGMSSSQANGTNSNNNSSVINEHGRLSAVTGSGSGSAAVTGSGSVGAAPDSDSNSKTNKASVSETLLYDSKGGSHYVGYSGTPVLFKLLCSMLLKRSYRTQLSFDSGIKLFQNKLSNKINYKQQYSHLLNDLSFPIVRNILSSKAQSDHCINYFFSYIHPFYFILDEQEFRHKHELFWRYIYNQPLTPQQYEALSTSFVGCLYLIWIISSKSSSSATSADAALDYNQLDNILQLMLTEISLNSSIPSIQFLYLYGVYLHANKNRDSSWNVIGLAIRQAVSLGLHKKFKEQEKDTLKKQVFWSLYQYELILCSSFGRQSNLNEDLIDVSLPSVDMVNSSDPKFKKFFVCILTLFKFLNKIIKERRSAEYTSKQIISLINVERTLSLKAQLIQIAKSLEIKTDSLDDINDIFDYKLNLAYHYYMITLTLPYLLYITTENFKIKDDETLLAIVKTGLTSAIKISQLLKLSLAKGFNFGAINTDCMYGYSSNLILSLFFVYLSNASNDLSHLQIELSSTQELVTLNKNSILEFNSDIIEFMSNSKLDDTTKRILEVIVGIRDDLKLVEFQSDLRFDVFNLDHLLTDESGQPPSNVRFDVYDSLFMNNEIYLDHQANNNNNNIHASENSYSNQIASQNDGPTWN